MSHSPLCVVSQAETSSGIFTTWDPPRLLSGDVGWFKEAFDASSKVTLADLQPTAFISDHITEVYGWDRDTIIFSAEVSMICQPP